MSDGALSVGADTPVPGAAALARYLRAIGIAANACEDTVLVALTRSQALALAAMLEVPAPPAAVAAYVALLG